MAIKNKISAILEALSDEDLKAAVLEMKALDDTGVLQPGKVREIAHAIQDATGATAHDARTIAHTGIIRIAAFRWAGAEHGA